MTVCKACKQSMSLANGCMVPLVLIHGFEYPRVKYGQERHFAFGRDDNGQVIPGKRCYDCNCLNGHYHHAGCAIEECPSCGHRLISCVCTTTSALPPDRRFDPVQDNDYWWECDPVKTNALSFVPVERLETELFQVYADLLYIWGLGQHPPLWEPYREEIVKRLTYTKRAIWPWVKAHRRKE